MRVTEESVEVMEWLRMEGEVDGVLLMRRRVCGVGRVEEVDRGRLRRVGREGMV